MESLQRRAGLPRRGGRGGVTLVELVVAIAIVALLASLTLILLAVGHRSVETITNQVSAVNPHAAPKRRSSAPMKPSTIIPNQYVVAFDNSVVNPQVAANQLAQTVPATILHVYTRAFKGCAVRIQPGQLPQLQAAANVTYIAPDQTRSLASIMPTGISRVRYVNAPPTPRYQLTFPPLPQYVSPGPSTGGGLVNGGLANLPRTPQPGVTTTPIIKAVAVIDTGIDPNHPDLNVAFSTSFGTGIPKSGDDFGHGTHCAGIIGARGKKIVGMFPNVPLWSIRVFPPAPPGQEPGASDTDIIAALDFVIQNANQVSAVNMSLGGPGIDPLLNTATTNCVKAGVVCCVAAGNDAKDATTYCPASAPQAICVAALCDTDGLPGGYGKHGSFGDPDDTMASFSNFGKVVAVMGPGEDILSTYPVAKGSYAVLSGTSMATPHVAGLAALLLGNTSTIIASSGGGGGLANLPINSSTTITSGPLVTTPADVLAWMLTESVETIPGLAANKDKLSYQLITGRP